MRWHVGFTDCEWWIWEVVCLVLKVERDGVHGGGLLVLLLVTVNGEQNLRKMKEFPLLILLEKNMGHLYNVVISLCI